MLYSLFSLFTLVGPKFPKEIIAFLDEKVESRDWSQAGKNKEKNLTREKFFKKKNVASTKSNHEKGPVILGWTLTWGQKTLEK